MSTSPDERRPAHASPQAPPAAPLGAGSCSFLIGPRPGHGHISQFEFTLAVTAALSALYGGLRIE